MTEEKKNVPALRFPEFSEEWALNNVGDLFDFKNGLNKEKEFFGYGSSIVNFKDVFNNRGINTKNLTGKVNVNDKELKNYSVKNGDVFFTRTSEVIDEIGYPSVILDNPENTVFSGFVLRARPKIGIKLVDNLFKRYVFFTTSFRKEMITKSSMTTRALTSGAAINKMEIKYPSSKNEQQKIGEFFSKLDRQIELEEEKLALLEVQKKGYMQKIFSQELRFKDDNGEDYPAWEEKKVAEIAKKTQSGGTPKTSMTEYWGGDLPWIQSSDLTRDNVIDVRINKFITKEGLKQSSVKLIPANSIAIVTRVGVGKIALLRENFSTSQDFLNLSDLSVDTLFALYRLYMLLKKEESSLQGTSIKGITKNDLLSKIVKVPVNFEEQQKIGEFFSKLDRHIKLQEQKINLFKKRKQGFLQKMFV
ncbi:restriction endonuclease subunit S [Staphylococcus delphini]|uniref:restriction endonuclease subunit S n=1 Tax=Staphylococcus delphini TaxID=53344 RepID=UPI0023B2939F|nr:restriction endonuclease subunit S [Staphylococcus delphini]MDE9800020.1 restriction endonuclease subunit S [Staphylococcus delphini]MDE9807572.1 restriction endonuclease subunit S [Staphylococcus delphini]